MVSVELSRLQVRPLWDEASAGTSFVKTGLGQKKGELEGAKEKDSDIIKGQPG